MCTLSVFAMQMRIPITMFHGFPFALFMQAVDIIHDDEWCFEDVRFESVLRVWVVVPHSKRHCQVMMNVDSRTRSQIANNSSVRG